MKRSTMVLMLALAMAIAPSLAHAASPWTAEQGYANQSVAKFKFGMKNVLLGWTEIFSETQKHTCPDMQDGKCTKKSCCPVTFGRGLGRGIVHFALDTVGGALHLVTFPLPQIDVPLPENGVDI